MGKKRSASSTRWLQEHFNDQFVKQAQKEGWRSRAVYKLQAMDEKDRLFRQGMTVVDLGAAPGGWSQYAADRIGESGRIVACDILPMDPLYGVEFVQGDFREEAVFNELLNVLDGRSVDLVMSDMAPNMSGTKAVDQPRAMYLVELALDMCRQVLAPDGTFVVKVFHGEGFDDYFREVRDAFKVVKTRKPDASRSRSRETYLVASGFKLV